MKESNGDGAGISFTFSTLSVTALRCLNENLENIHLDDKTRAGKKTE